MWLLLVEDERRLAASLKKGLEEEGYAVAVAGDAVEAFDLASANAYDLMVVDRRLPRGDGLHLVQRLRDAGQHVPILMLTALSSIEHRVTGLDAGADDYLAKPFAFQELLARLRALGRRTTGSTAMPMAMGPLELDGLRREVRVGSLNLLLRPKEYILLEVLLRHPEQVLSRTMLAERVWGDAFHIRDNVIDVTVSGLRQKLSEALEAAGQRGALAIETVRGVGYRLATKTQQR